MSNPPDPLIAPRGGAPRIPDPGAERPRPRVLHVIGGAGIGGTERQLLALLPRLDRYADAHVLLIRGGVLAAQFRAPAPTSEIPKLGKVDPVFLARLVAVVRRARPDLVHAWGSTANLWGPVAARMAGHVPVIMSEVALDAWKGRLLRAADRRNYARAALVTGNSAAVVDAAVARGAARERTLVVPNGVVVPAAPAPPGDREPDLVLFLGRLHPDKGPDLFVEAFAVAAGEWPELRAVVAGPAEQPVERRLAAAVTAAATSAGLDGRISFVGPVADPVPLLRRAAVLAVPSRTEGSPNVVLEAMAHGTPIVATAVGGVPELLQQGGFGRLVPPGDPVAFGHGLVATLRNPAEAAETARRAREYVETWRSLEAVAARWAEVYRQVGSRRERRLPVPADR